MLGAGRWMLGAATSSAVLSHRVLTNPQVDRRIAKMKRRIDNLRRTHTLLGDVALQRAVTKQLDSLEQLRDTTRTFIHVDMDMYVVALASLCCGCGYCGCCGVMGAVVGAVGVVVLWVRCVFVVMLAVRV